MRAVQRAFRPTAVCKDYDEQLDAVATKCKSATLPVFITQPTAYHGNAPEDRGIERRHAAPRVGDIIRSCADVTRLTGAFGAPPATDMRAGLRRLLEYPRLP